MRINRTLVSYDIIKLQRRKSMNQPRIQRHYENSMIPFSVEAPFQPMGDQPKAIDSLTRGLQDGQWAQVLLGATGTGKTYTMAKVIEAAQRPTLIISPNKHWRHRRPVNLRIFSLIMQYIILSAITIIISRNHIFRRPIPI